MRKIYWLLAVLSLVGIMSCEDDNDPAKFDPEMDITEERGSAPGEKYVTGPDTKYVDVLYFVPNDMTPVNDWHWRLSGIVCHIQEYFAGNLSKYYNIEKKFELVKNEANPKYVDIRLVTGEHPAAFYQDSLGTIALTNELVKYYENHPEAKTSHQHIVFAPRVFGKMDALQHLNGEKTPDDFFTFLGCDHENLNIKYFRYDLYRERYLKDMGMMLYLSAVSFGLMNNDAPASAPYLALMSSGLYSYVTSPEAVRMTQADALILSECEVFNPQSNDIKYDVLPNPKRILMQSVNIETQSTKFVLTCTFMTEQPVATLLAFHDPWRAIGEGGQADEGQDIDTLNGGTTFDAVLFGTSDLQETVMPGVGYLYNATINVPMTSIKDEYKEALPGNDYAKAEFRFQLLFKNGFKYPDDVKCGEYFADAQMRTNRFRYQYYWAEAKPMIPFRTVKAQDKNTWSVAGIYPEGNEEGGLTFDGQTNTLWKVPFDKDADDKPEILINFNAWTSMKGIMIHRGTAKDKAKKITITAYPYDWDVADVVPEEVCSKALLVGTEDMYYYFDYRKDNVMYLNVKIEDSEGKETVSLAEIGVY